MSAISYAGFFVPGMSDEAAQREAKRVCEGGEPQCQHEEAGVNETLRCWRDAGHPGAHGFNVSDRP